MVGKLSVPSGSPLFIGNIKDICVRQRLQIAPQLTRNSRTSTAPGEPSWIQHVAGRHHWRDQQYLACGITLMGNLVGLGWWRRWWHPICDWQNHTETLVVCGIPTGNAHSSVLWTVNPNAGNHICNSNHKHPWLERTTIKNTSNPITENHRMGPTG